MKQIVMYKTTWCGDCQRSEKIFKDLGVAYKKINIDEDQVALALVEKINHGSRSVPTIVFPDGAILVEPTSAALSQALESFLSA